MDVPDQGGKVILITGGTSGIGKETAVSLAGAGATTVITGRDQAKSDRAVAEVRRRAANDDVHAVALDLASLASVRATASTVLERWDRLDVLVNNAGAFNGAHQFTADGHELTFGANYLGHFLLTQLLVPRLSATAPSRVVTVASLAHRFAVGGMAFDDLDMEDGYNGWTAYNRSKLATVLFTGELARRLATSGISAFAVHPGLVASAFGRTEDSGKLATVAFTAVRPLLVSAASGARASVHVATAPGLETRSGGYFQRLALGNYGPVREVRPSGRGRDASAARRLWELSEEMVAAS